MTSVNASESHPLLINQHTAPAPPSSTSDLITASNNDAKQEPLGYLFMLISALGFAIHAFCIRLSEAHFHISFSVNLLSRGLIHFVFSIIYFLATSPPSQLFTTYLNKRQLFFLGLRGLVGALGLLIFYYAVNLIPLGDSVAIFFLVPIFTLLLSRACLSEPIKKSDLVAVTLSFIGACLIARSQQQDQQNLGVSSTMKVIGSLLIVLGAFLASVAYTIIRYLGTNISFMSSILSFASCCIIVSLFTNGFSNLYDVITDKDQRLALIPVAGAGLISFIAQCGLNLGLQRARAGPAILLSNIQVPITFTLAFIFLHEVPSVLSVIGSTCVVSAALLVGISKIWQR